jgi:hypothetical protein
MEGTIINVSNASGLSLHGKCLLDTDDALWLMCMNHTLLWVKRSPDLVVAIDEYSEDDYLSLEFSKEFSEFITLFQQ